MPSKFIQIAAAMALATSWGSAYAMTNASPDELSCTVEGADKLPAGMGADGICGAIRAAAGAESRGSVIVRVKSRHVITVAVTDVRGVSLPEIGASVADAELSPRTVERLAQEVARQLRGAR